MSNLLKRAAPATAQSEPVKRVKTAVRGDLHHINEIKSTNAPLQNDIHAINSTLQSISVPSLVAGTE